MKTLILVPTQKELALLESTLARFGQHDSVSIEICGVGPAVSAMTSHNLISDHRPQRVILVGLAGAFPQSKLQLGAVVCGFKDRFADLGYESESQFFTLEEMGLCAYEKGDKRIGTQFFCEVMPGLKSVEMITVSSMSASHARAAKMWHSFAAATESMEGASVAMVCAEFELPFLQIRTVSNFVGPRDPATWQIAKAMSNLDSYLCEYLSS